LKNYYSDYKATTPTECNKVFQQLVNERSTFDPSWRELCEYILPTRSRFYVDDVNRGTRKNHKIIDSTATYSSNILRAGMMSGVTSPSRQWFRLGVSDQKLEGNANVKRWTEEVTNILLGTFIRSNLYNMLPLVYGDLGTPGTSAMLIEEDADSVMRTYVFPVGSYVCSANAKGKVDTFGREFRMTVRQIVEKFGYINGDPQNIDWSNISSGVKDLYMSNQTEAWINIRHMVKPNPDYVVGSADSKKFRYVSLYWEHGGNGLVGSLARMSSPNVFLSKKGFKYFPVLVARWETSAEDSYATNSPGMTVIGDVKQLQVGEKFSAKAIQKQVDPPMVGTPELEDASMLPGGLTITSNVDNYKQAQAVNLSIRDLEFKQDQCRDRIKKGYYVDLFLMLASSERSQITATEIRERYEEKLLALGPVLQQLNQDLLDPLIDIAFDIHLDAGLIPEAPKELEGMPLKVEYISIMAQAQKMAGIAAVDTFTDRYMSFLAVDPNIRHKVNTFELMNIYGDFTGVPSKALRTNEEAQVLMMQEVAAQQAAQQAQMDLQVAQTNAANANAINTAAETQGVDELIRQTMGV